MALDWNYAIKEGHKVAQPFIIKGIDKGLTKVDEIVAESGTIADDLISVSYTHLTLPTSDLV